MSQSDLAISIRGLSKSYTIAHGGLKKPSFRELCMDRLRNPFRRPETETFWALNDVSFDVKKGEVVGIIGRNGAGKSTLLKILSRITEPTGGEIDVYGRIGSLLEVGTGFHPELTGRENIYLNGAILGMRRAEITKQFDAIVDFAEIEKFLDTPVKRYSSGMYVRLAFAVAAHLDPEILIVDEVLAVGDAEFQKKCLGKMKDVARGGRTILFVSHNLDALLGLCNTAILFSRGQIRSSGPVADTVRVYLQGREHGTPPLLSDRPRSVQLSPEPLVREFKICGANGNQAFTTVGGPLTFEIATAAGAVEGDLECGIVICNENRQRVSVLHSRFHSRLMWPSSTNARVFCQVDEVALIPGRYTVDIVLNTPHGQLIESIEDAASFDVVFADYLNTGLLPSQQHGHVILRASWSVRVNLIGSEAFTAQPSAETQVSTLC